MIDFHSHLLYGIDDGSKNIGMSVAMLKESERQGIEISVATPHFYFNKKTDKIIQKRDKVCDKLIKYAQKNKINIPEIVLGFEVYLEDKIFEEPDLDRLKINGTNTMLVEMPRAKWDDAVFGRLDYVAGKGYDIVLAHPERYCQIADDKDFDRLFSYGFACQLNAASLINPNTRDFAYKLIKEGRIKLMGSDAHNVGTRANFIGIACEFIRNNLGEEYIDKMNENAERYLGL